MRKSLFTRSLFVVLLISTLAALLVADEVKQQKRLLLTEGWSLQSSSKVVESGDIISTSAFSPKGWYAVSVPTTVVAALVEQKVYPDPTFGTNLRQIPGVTYPIGENFSKLAIDPASPFAKSWWYRKSFTLPTGYSEKTIWLNLQGVNYRANLWVNGTRIGDVGTVAGAWRAYELDITKLAHPGAENVIAVQVFAPQENDLAITFVDWNPMPPDRDMGLFREVYVSTSGPLALRYPAVMSEVNTPVNSQAQLTVTAQLKNASNKTVKGTLKGKIEDVEFAQEVEIAPGETRDVTFEPDKFAQLSVVNPRLWWPAQMGTPNLYPLHMEIDVDGKISDEADSQFGIRKITSEAVEETSRVFSINGKKILIRGGGWSVDFMLRENSRRLEQELNYVQDMGLNTIRLEGRPETPEFYEQTDRRGILVMAGWSCCDFWEQWPQWTEADHEIARQSLKAQMLRLRGHPSLLMWLNGSDNPPPPDVEQVYLSLEKELRWPNPILSSATAKPSAGSKMNGVRMTGPYEFVAPSYWTEDSTANQPGHQCDLGGCGGAHGFNTETSPGAAVPPIESLRTMLGRDHLWPMDDSWNFHAGGEGFKDIHVFSGALNARYGKAENVEDYALKSQLMAYEGIRAMFEGYSRNKYVSTGVIQWMLNNGWPSTIWHLYDYYLRPGGGYFGAKTALQPLHPLYSYDDHSIWVVSSQYQDAKNLRLFAEVFNLDSTKKFSREVTLDANADSANREFVLPEIQGLSPTYFLRLTLRNLKDTVVGSNLYWLSTTPEVVDWEKSNWFDTPVASYADYTALSRLSKVKLRTTIRNERTGEKEVTHVVIENPSSTLAFFVRLKINKGVGGEEVLPVLWEDNYVSLFPGEKREIAARYSTEDIGSAQPSVEVQGWNVE